MVSHQQPLDSGFTAASTTGDVISGIDLSGKTAIVTGGYAGLGLETVRTLASAGATVIVPARNTEKAQAALDGIANAEIAMMDLIDPRSIEAVADRFSPPAAHSTFSSTAQASWLCPS